MKKSRFLILFIICSSTLFSQEWVKNINKADPSFYDIQKAFNDYYNSHFHDWDKDDEYKAFKRWEYFMEARVNKKGFFTQQNSSWEAYNQLNLTSAKAQAIVTSSWTPLGPQYQSAGYAGVGRINCLQFDPSSPNTLWAGAACGGVWKSTNAGTSWTDMTSNTPNLSVSDIAIHPNNGNTLYIATGDGYGSVSWGAFWGGRYSAGVMKSVNGGLTWTPTSLNYLVSQQHVINRLIIHPLNGNILFAAGTDGLYKSSNAGSTWTKVKDGRFYDVEFNPLNPNTIYTTKDSVFKSVNGGATWQYIGGTPIAPVAWYPRISVETTAADTNYVYLLDHNNNFYKSTNGGNSWNQMVSFPNLGTYMYYGTVLSACPTNKNLVYAAGYNIVKTTDGGLTETIVTTGATSVSIIHPDHHDIKFYPGTTTIYSANDGGVHASSNGGSTWTNYSDGLQVTQFYKLGTSVTNTNLILAGAQDNGTFKYSSGTWSITYLQGDGMESIIDYTNPNIFYTSIQTGSFVKSNDAGATYTALTTGLGPWVTQMVMHPTNSSILFFGGTELKKSMDGGNTWNNITNGTTGGMSILSLAVSKSNPNYIYISTMNSIYRTTDGGSTWTDITGSLPTNYKITGICISGSDPNKVWITYSGYTTGQKVFKTVDGGSSWNNISGTLPNIPFTCIASDDNSTVDAVYAGSDIGVFYLDNNLGTNNWIPFNTNLPAVIVSELEINYTSQKIYAATYGRGLWSSALNPPSIPAEVREKVETKSTISSYPNPASDLFYIDINSSGETTTVIIEITDLQGRRIRRLSDIDIAHKQYKINCSGLIEGVYFVNVKTGFENKTFKVIVNPD